MKLMNIDRKCLISLMIESVVMAFILIGEGTAGDIREMCDLVEKSESILNPSLTRQTCGGSYQVPDNDCQIIQAEVIKDWRFPIYMDSSNQRELHQTAMFLTLECREAVSCKLDLGVLLLEKVQNSEHEMLYLSLTCSEAIHVVLTNMEHIHLHNVLCHFTIKRCQIFWMDIGLLGQAVDLRFLHLQHWHDLHEREVTLMTECELEKPICGCPFSPDEDHALPMFPIPNKGLSNVTSVDIYQLYGGEVPAIFTHYYWPSLTELILRHAVGITSPNLCYSNLPVLQSLVITGANLHKVPESFPWHTNLHSNHSHKEHMLNNSPKLPRNLARTPIGQDDYATSIHIDIPANQYRRLLILDNNHIEQLISMLPEGQFHKISLRHNQLTTINSLPFLRFDGGVQVLDLGYNRLKSITNPVFRGLRNSLEKIHLQYNQIHGIPPSAFHDFKYLKVIDLSCNKLSFLHSWFFSLPSLEDLKLSNNSISQFESDPDIISHSLRQLDISDNKLKTLPRWLMLHPDLGHLNVSGNLITFYGFIQAFQHLSPIIDHSPFIMAYSQKISLFSYDFNQLLWPTMLRILDLSFNKIETIQYSTSSDAVIEALGLLLSRVRVYIRGSVLYCDCRVLPIHTALGLASRHPVVLPHITKHNNQQWRCGPDPIPGLSGKLLAHISPSSLRCYSHMDECPSKCDCKKNPVDGSVAVNCSRAGYTVFPASLPPLTTELYLDYNKLGQEVQKSSSTDTQVDHVELHTSYSNVRSLSLRYNRLEYLPAVIRSLNLREVMLAGNPLVCDCHAGWMLDWLSSQPGLLIDSQQVFCCSGPAKGQLLLDSNPTSYICEDVVDPEDE